MRNKRKIGMGLAALAVSAVPAVAGAGGPDKDRVNGHGLLVGGSVNHFAFNAQSGPSGEDPKGQGHFHDNTDKDGTAKARFNGPVTCLRVSGNRASFVLDFRNTKNQSGPRQAVLITVEDNGNPSGPSSPDRIGVQDLLMPLTVCPDPNTQPANGQPEKGDIRVEDALP